MARILITIPTWNEATVIEQNLQILQSAIKKYLPTHDITIEVADNGSTDETREIVRALSSRLQGEISPPIALFPIDEKGKGLAIRRSWERHVNDADILVFMDADLAADLSALPSLINPFLTHQSDLVCGSRFVHGAKIKRAPLREFASRMYRTLQQLILKLPVQDAQCGFKGITADAARKILPLCHEQGWMFDTELIALAHRHDFRIMEIPISWIEHRNPARRSAIKVFTHGWGFIAGLFRILRSQSYPPS